MKKIFLHFLLLTFNLYPNILLQRPYKISDQEVKQLAKEWETSFSWIFKQFSFTCLYENKEASFMVSLLGIPLRSYNFQYLENIKKYFKNRNESLPDYYFAEPLKLVDPNPQQINFDQLCDLLQNKTFIFYTGAGISASQVPTLYELNQLFNFNNIKKLVTDILFNPKKITGQFSQFCKKALYGNPTEAHYALKFIAEYKNINILTENIDLLQQRTGIVPIFTHSDEANSITINNLQEIDIIVCLGLSHDDCGFLANYKKNNPNAIVIAIDLGMPNYLSDNDFILQEDLQEILPKLANYIAIL
ncbi:MAG: hypothetical protein WDZ41_05240 [Candidatus Babeliales bacterium]